MKLIIFTVILVALVVGLLIFWWEYITPNPRNLFGMTSSNLVNATILSPSRPTFIPDDPYHIRPAEGVVFKTTKELNVKLTNDTKVKYLMTCVIINKIYKKDNVQVPYVFDDVQELTIPKDSEFFIIFSKNVNIESDENGTLPIESSSETEAIPISTSEFDKIKPLLTIT